MTGAEVRPALPNPTIDRRKLLRNGGLAISMGAILAACGDRPEGDPGRVGLAPPGSTLPTETVDDVVLLRTAQSLEYTAIDVYAAAADLGVLDATLTAVVERFVEDHTGHAAAVGELIVAAGGEEFPCANPWIMNRAVTPILEAVAESDDVLRDVLNIAHAFESLAAATYQDLVGALTSPELRQAAMQIGADEARHAATLAIAITGAPEAYFSPGLADDEVLPDEDGFPIPYAVPSVFGQVGSVELIVGAQNDEGGRLVLNLQTPAENTFVYTSQSCSAT
jgi:rubrerythrin